MAKSKELKLKHNEIMYIYGLLGDKAIAKKIKVKLQEAMNTKSPQ